MVASSKVRQAVSVQRRRAPAISVLLVFVAGIVLDSLVSWSGWVWLSAIGAALATAVVARFAKQHWLSVSCLLIAVAAAGAVRHHDAWSVGEANEIGLFATDEARPAQLRGVITQRPIVSQADGNESPRGGRSRTRTTFVIRCRQLRDGDKWVEVTGLVRVDIASEVSGLRIGDEVQLIGRLALPFPPGNVGEFDFAAMLRRQGIRAVLRCRSQDAVSVCQRHDGLCEKLQRWQMAGREQCETLLKEKLSPETTSVAIALLLGTRTRMSPLQREAFVESGTMHVLAISGLNVAILAMFVSVTCRLLNLSRAITAVLLLTLVGGYTAITDAGPPVVRASLLVYLAALGWPWDRPVHSSNLLAVTGLGVLLWTPTDAFSVGAQLSFLAVAVILWQSGRHRMAEQADAESDPNANEQSASTDDKLKQEPTTKRDVIEALEESLPTTWPRRLFRLTWYALRESVSVSIFIWIFTAPVIAGQFHLVSPVGVLANIPLLPVASVALCLGYSVLMLGFVSSTLAGWLAVLFDWSLRLMLLIVDVAARFSCGHLYVPTPPTWWLVGAAVCLASLFWWRSRMLRRHLGWKAFCVWLIIGLLVPLIPRQPGPLRCTVLSVGHGLSVLIETPGGRTLLYDAGTMGDSRRATNVVQQALWYRGLSHLDGIVLSHADSDHINGVSGLIRTLPVKRLFVSPQFLDWRQPAVSEVLNCVSHCEVPIQLIWQGDSLRLDEGVHCRVLHPQAEDKLANDNANSVVLSIEYAGRRLLLTGDLERDGLARLLQTEPIHADVLVSPHHGSLGANTTDLARWARPSWLAVSGDRRVSLATLRTRFGPNVDVLSTSEYGAITFEIDSRGQLTCDTFRRGRVVDEEDD